MDSIRMIAIDLDDTLLSDDITVSDKTIRTIQMAKQKGVEVIIATGRMYSTARPYGKMLQLGDIPMMLFSGALIQTVESGTIMYHNPIDQSSANRLLAMAKANHWMMQTYIDDVLRVPVHNHWIAGYESITGIHAVVAGDAFYEVSGCPSKILAYGEPEELVAMAQQIEQELPGVFTLMRSKPTFLEIVRKGVSKGDGLRNLCQYLHIPLGQVMAIGNSQNDLAMLDVAGLSVAVANAEANVREAVDYVTTSNNEDGVAAAIERFVL